jgi:parvulin-like peptidyl-prolyl isomerase
MTLVKSSLEECDFQCQVYGETEMAVTANACAQGQGTRLLKRVLTWFVMSVLFVCGTLVAQQQPANRAQPPQKQIETLAVVNGQPITRQQVANECLSRFGEDVLEDIVSKLLVLNECAKKGVTITEKDVNDEIVSEAQKFGMSGDRWLKLISEERDMSIDQIKNGYVWNKLALRRLVAGDIRVTKEELQEQMEFEFGTRVQVRQIVLNSKQQAEEVLTAARANPENFERLAKQHSIDPNTRPVGGLLPPVRRHSGLPAFENVAFGLRVGQISEVVQVADKFIVLKCERFIAEEKLTPEQLTSVHDRLVEKITQAKMTDAAVDLSKRMQQTAKIQNVMNDPQLRQQMPGVAAIVNNDRILKKDVAEECILRFGKDMLETEVNRMLLNQALEQQGLQVTQADVDAEIGREAEAMGHMKKDGTVDMDRWLKFVTNNDLSKTDFYVKDGVWPQAAARKIVEGTVEVSKEDMIKGFEANFGPRVEVLLILTQDHRQALKVWNMATANPTAAYFGELANQYSIEPASKNNFGEVEAIQKHGGRAEVEKEAFSLQTGEISKVVQVGQYWAIMYCRGQTEPVVTDFDVVKDELHKNIYEKKLRLAMSDRFMQMKEEAQIDNFLAGTSQPGKANVDAIRQASRRQSNQR